MDESKVLERHVYASFLDISNNSSFLMEHRINTGKYCVDSDFEEGHKDKLLRISKSLNFPEEVRIYALNKFLEMSNISDEERKNARKELKSIEHPNLKLNENNVKAPQSKGPERRLQKEEKTKQ